MKRNWYLLSVIASGQLVRTVVLKSAERHVDNVGMFAVVGISFAIMFHVMAHPSSQSSAAVSLDPESHPSAHVNSRSFTCVSHRGQRKILD